MELKIFFIFSLILCGSTFKVAAKGATCDFGGENEEDYYDVIPNYYACSIKSFDFSGNDAQTVITGDHQDDKSDDDVKAVDCLSCSAPVQIFDINFCNKFENLEQIKLWSLEIEQVDPKTFEKCQKLKNLDVNGNKMVEIPENLLSELPKLFWLSFNQNQISSIAENAFKNQKKLLMLNLSSNQISSLPPNVFKPLINLSKLLLKGNLLTTIHSDCFGAHRQLELVNLAANKINAIDEKFIDNITAIDELHMNGNICNGEKINARDEMKEKLQQCFINYQPREVPVTSATPNEENSGTKVEM